jgi:hypothetical protein
MTPLTVDGAEGMGDAKEKALNCDADDSAEEIGSKRSRVNYYQDPINSILAPLARLTYSEAAPRMYPIFSLIAPIEIPG